MTRRQANVIIALLAVLVLAFVVRPLFFEVVANPNRDPVAGFVRDWQRHNDCVALLAEPTPSGGSWVTWTAGAQPQYVPALDQRVDTDGLYAGDCRHLLGVTPPPVPTPAPTPTPAPYVPLNCAYGTYWDNMTGENACNPPPVLLPTPGTPALPPWIIDRLLPLPSVP